MRKSLTAAWVGLVPILLALVAPGAAWAQAGRIELPSFAGLAAKATNSVNISLDPSLIGLASQFAGNGPDQAAVKTVMSGLKAVYVRSFQFGADYAYPRSDVNEVLQQLEARGWIKLVSVHNTHPRKDVEVCLLEHGKRVEGLVVLAAEPRQFTIVNIVGSISLAQLSQLQGKFGVPKLPMGPNGFRPPLAPQPQKGIGPSPPQPPSPPPSL
ncbi:MAG: DUF4252 domain-containing protein [Steroidobacteraceae bacterium]